MKDIRISDKDIGAIARALEASGLAAISGYELGKTAFQVLAEGPAVPLKARFSQLVDQLCNIRLLWPLQLPDSASAYTLFGKVSSAPAEIACSLDPFAYVSHLSAMEYYGLTDRFPSVLFMLTPSDKSWRLQARERMHKDLGAGFDEYIRSGLPKLKKYELNRIAQTSIQFHERSQLGAFRHVADSPMRVATIGRVFLDMIREPHLCGGMQHVIDVYRAEARRYLRLIVDDVEQWGTAIDKVRAGFLLSDVCGLEDPVMDGWVQYAQRGGSRKLDPEGEYAATYSERWKLSLNVPEFVSPPEPYDE